MLARLQDLSAAAKPLLAVALLSTPAPAVAQVPARVRLAPHVELRLAPTQEAQLLAALERLFAPTLPAPEAALLAPGTEPETLYLLEKMRSTARIVPEPTAEELPRVDLAGRVTLDSNRSLLRISCTDPYGALLALWSLIVTVREDGSHGFSAPLGWHTADWSRRTVGRVEYVYRGGFDLSVARSFDARNTRLAELFGVPCKELLYYRCANYAEAQRILGIDYDAERAGVSQSSEDFANTIVTGVGSEDFSHDLLHMYVKTRFPDDTDRNGIAEEGYAVGSTNAYYAKLDGSMIAASELVECLRSYLDGDPPGGAYELFTNPINIFQPLRGEVSPEVLDRLSAKSTISSLLCAEIERRHGFEGLLAVLRCGRTSADFMEAIRETIGVDPSNFDREVRRLASSAGEESAGK